MSAVSPPWHNWFAAKAPLGRPPTAGAPIGTHLRRTLTASSAAAIIAALGSVWASGSAAAADTATGRNYEQIMPVGHDFPFGSAGADLAVGSVTGDAIVYISEGPQPGAASGTLENYNIARRSSSGWSSEPIAPREDPAPNRPFMPFTQGFSADLSKMFLLSGEPPLTPDAPTGVESLYMGDTTTGGFDLLTVNPGTPGLSQFARIGGWSDDFTHVVFESWDPLLPDAAQNGLYDWSDGQIRNVAIYPDGSPATGGVILGHGASQQRRVTHAVSDDGRRIVFADSDVYIRIDGTSTVAASASQRDTPDTAGGFHPPAEFWAASKDTRKVFFTSPKELTNDANTGDDGSGNTTDAGKDLYLYDLDTGHLSDLTVDTDPADAATGADVQGVIGASDDAQYVYFVARGVLAPGAASGANNLYVDHAGQTKYIGALDNADQAAWAVDLSDRSGGFGLTARVTPDGLHLAIQSVARLTAYDNTDPTTGTPTRQVYRYAADSGALMCVSCRPDGAAPSGDATIAPPKYEMNISRNLADDGRRVFFDSSDAIVRPDTNGRTDVYEWTEDGGVALVSDGRQSADAHFMDASATGRDVFFATSARLVATDVDEHYELYDARLGGGFPGSVATRKPPCEGDACQGAPGKPLDPPVAATVSFVGPDDEQAPEEGRDATIKVTRPKPVTGTSAVLKLRVPGKGSLTVAGSGLSRVRKSVTKSGTLNVRVSLTKKSRATLRRRHHLKASAKVTFTPSRGKSASVKVALTFKQPKASKKGRS